MNVRLILSLIFLSIAKLGLGQYWQSSSVAVQERSTLQIQSHYVLDFARLAKTLKSKSDKILVQVPMPDGSLQDFKLRETSVFQNKLQAKYPNITSYTGFNSKNGSIIKISLNQNEVQFFVKSSAGNIVVKRKGEKHNYYSFYEKERYQNEINHFKCGTISHSENLNTLDPKQLKQEKSLVNLQEYVIAIATTGEWTKSQGGTVDDALQSINTILTRLNLIYEVELSVNLKLSEENEKIIWLDGATDPYLDEDSGAELLTVNTININNEIDQSSYDIGHVFTNRCKDVGGVALLGVVCDAQKGAGVTCFSSDNLDLITVSIIAHEIGHQFGANHSFNNCGGNENFGTAYEPGGGSTIMSYAGLCGNNNIQNFTDDYFHSISLSEIFSYLRDGTGERCDRNIALNNSEPIIKIDFENQLYIPIQTPFYLNADAEDDDEDVLTYTWEQVNLGPMSNLGDPIDEAPRFRSIYPSGDSHRIIPSLDDLVNNRNRSTEVLPDKSLEMKFRCIVRDNHIGGGSVVWEDVSINSTAMAGPFLVNDNLPEEIEIGEHFDITWDVANTNQEPVNCSKVDLYLSTDGGYNFDILLASGIENDGQHSVIAPLIKSEQVRIKVQAVENIFFDISNSDIKITEPATPTFSIDIINNNQFVCAPGSISLPIQSLGFNAFDEKIKFSIEENTMSIPFSFSKEEIEPNETSELVLNIEDPSISGTASLNLKAKAGDIVISRAIELNIINNNFESVSLMNPINGSSGNSSLLQFEWSQDNNVDFYSLQVSDNPSFAEEDILIDLEFIAVNDIQSETLLAKNTLYYAKLYASNDCITNKEVDFISFYTEALNCNTFTSEDLPINISASGTREVRSVINVTNEGTLKDVNIIKVNGQHEQVSDLKFTLRTPSGSEVILFDRQCGNLANFNVGFDDEAISEIICPVIGGTTFRPENNLSILNEENMAGEWTMIINDESPGSGGSFSEFVLELCSDFTSETPILVENNILQTPPKLKPRITEELLKVTDQDNSEEELLYTIVRTPNHGNILDNEQIVEVGQSFTQADILNNEIRYSHEVEATDTDSFDFVVEDGEGGWINITSFNISISSDFVSSNFDEELESNIQIYPTLLLDKLTIKSSSSELSQFSIRVYNLVGNLVSNHIVQKNSKELNINTASWRDGIYFITLQDGNQIYTQKLIKI